MLSFVAEMVNREAPLSKLLMSIIAMRVCCTMVWIYLFAFTRAPIIKRPCVLANWANSGSRRCERGRTGVIVESITVTLVPKRLSGIRAVHATLLGREVVVRGSGTDRRTFTKTIHRQSVRLADPPDMRLGYEVQFTGEVTIPQTAAPSFTLPDNRLEWSIEIDVDIARWADWSENRTILVRAPPIDSDTP